MESMQQQYKITLKEEDALLHWVCQKMRAMAEIRMVERMREPLGRALAIQNVSHEDTLHFCYTIEMEMGALLAELGEIRRTTKKKGKKQ